MDFAKIPYLIKDTESQELYKYQVDIINNQSLSDEEILIRLAIIQTLSPIEDWESASEILREHIHAFGTFNLIIGAFIALTAFELTRYKNIDYFVSLVNKKMSDVEGELLSVMCFIKAKYIIEKDGPASEVIELLKQSISLGPRFVMNYLEMSNYVENEFKKQCFHNAYVNVQSVYNNINVGCIGTLDLIEPVNFFNEKIIRTDINCYLYKDIAYMAQ